MNRLAAATLLTGVVTLGGLLTAHADPDCNGFVSNSDGSWTPFRPTVIGALASQIQIMPNDRIRAVEAGLRGRVARDLDAWCRRGLAGGPLGIPKNP